MDLLSIREIASVKLFTIEVSEDELDVFEACMKYVLETLSATEAEQICGAHKGELNAINKSVSLLLEKNTNLR